MRHALWMAAIVGIAILPLANLLARALPTAVPTLSPLVSLSQLPASVDSITVVATREFHWQAFIGPAVLGVWIAGTLITLFASCRTYRRSRRLRAAGRREVRRDFLVPLVYSPECSVPAVVGILHPVVLLPENIEHWTSEVELRAILLHEAAHLERRDHWTGLLQTAVGSVFFFHPAVRYALRQLVLERELACDERVLAAGLPSATYAETILKVAERSLDVSIGDCPAFHSQQLLERRITMILEHRFTTVSGWQSPTIARLAVVVCLAALVLPQRSMTAAPQFTTHVPASPSEAELRTLSATLVPVAAAKASVAVQAQPQPTAAQNTGERVSGTIFDQTGAVIPGVRVALWNDSAQLSATTNVAGTFSFSAVVPGQYRIQASLPGFQIVDRSFAVLQGRSNTMDVILPVGKMQTHVEVSSSKAPAPQNAAGTPQNVVPQRVGGDISAPVLLSAIKPIYPTFAREKDVQGVVVLQGVIGTDGSVLLVQLESSESPGLVGAAIEAVKRWRYKPAMLNGVPIEFPTTITVNFTLTD
jgi:TonB family protein